MPPSWRKKMSERLTAVWMRGPIDMSSAQFAVSISNRHGRSKTNPALSPHTAGLRPLSALRAPSPNREKAYRLSLPSNDHRGTAVHSFALARPQQHQQAQARQAQIPAGEREKIVPS